MIGESLFGEKVSYISKGSRTPVYEQLWTVAKSKPNFTKYLLYSTLTTLNKNLIRLRVLN
jgi:hypothetical protein